MAHILRFRKHALKSHRATRITAGQDSDRACGLAGIFLCTSVIMELPPHARHSHYWIIIWQMSVWLTALTGWSERVSFPPHGCEVVIGALAKLVFKMWFKHDASSIKAFFFLFFRNLKVNLHYFLHHVFKRQEIVVFVIQRTVCKPCKDYSTNAFTIKIFVERTDIATNNTNTAESEKP